MIKNLKLMYIHKYIILIMYMIVCYNNIINYNSINCYHNIANTILCNKQIYLWNCYIKSIITNQSIFIIYAEI